MSETIKQEIEKWFPKMRGKDYKVIIDNRDYNCVSYTLEIYTGWMWSSTEMWPVDSIPRNLGVGGFLKLYNMYGYIECENEAYENGYEKIVFFSKNGAPSHACKQYYHKWRSKLGSSVIIEHDLEWIIGYNAYEYGDVSFIVKKKIS